MTFLNPLLLFGLAAAAIPILIHLFNRRKLRTIDFSSLRFLKELQKTTIRRVKIRQWLLLLIRTLLIASLVLAFSRPAIKGSFAGVIGSRAKTTMVILLDDSPSMTVRTDRGVAFSLAQQSALQLLSVFTDGDVAYVVPLSAIQHTGRFAPLYNTVAMRSAIEKASPSQASVRFREAFATAGRLLSEKRNLNQEVFLVSDMQTTMFTQGTPGDTAHLLEAGTNVFLLRAGQDVDNAGILSVDVRSRILVPGRPIQVEIGVGNYGKLPLHGAIVSAYLDGVRQVQQLVDAPPYEKRTVDVAVLPRKAGLLHGYAQIDDDAFGGDNRRYFVLPIPERIPVLVVSGSEGDARLPLLALRTAEDSSGTGLFDVQFLPASQLPGVSLHEHAVLILCGMKQFVPPVAGWLAQFVQAGGGLILFPALNPDIDNYNAELFSRLGIPAARFSSTDSLQSSAGFTFGNIDLAHPVFSDLFENSVRDQRHIESPTVRSAIVPRPGVNGQTIIGLTNSQGFLTEYRSGEGKLFLFSIEAGMTGSDFPVKGLFVPLLHRSVLYLATETDRPDSLKPGDNPRISVRAAALNPNGVFSLVAPSGSTEKLVPVIAPSTGVATFTGTTISEPGIYELTESSTGNNSAHQKDSVLKALAVNIAPAESDLREAHPDQLREFCDGLGISTRAVTMIEDPVHVAPEVLQSRFGVELWKYFVLLALICAFAEMIIGREPRQNGHATDTTGTP